MNEKDKKDLPPDLGEMCVVPRALLEEMAALLDDIGAEFDLSGAKNYRNYSFSGAAKLRAALNPETP